MGARAFFIAAAVGLGFWLLVWVNDRLDRANKADQLETEVADLKAEAAAKDEKYAAVETELQAHRLQATEINKKWSRVRAQQTRNPCQLDADTIGVLKAAGDPR